MTALDPTLLERAFDTCYPAIFRYFRYRGADADTANDLAAAAFERALKHLHQFDPRKAQIQTWLFAIAHNLAVNHWKFEAAHTTEALDGDTSIPDDPLLEETLVLAQEKSQVLLAVQSLDGRARQVLALKFAGALTNRQIAGITGLTESNVGVILYRSLIKLRALLISSTSMEGRHDQ
jgi:RNA polymerase sigma-70 factor (ECF subfamily)